ncbi:alpha/beta hydrolase-fold protein [Ichthyenterobacterium sp. W332]|uniref:Alpha/beta hydrolase-fold protein n=1 Tax=Microcosmobacter mediterraneus TaxID=3075607 RepID=A0ABU2YLJ8_9FLAO|nr:alpha/beta hydrolase-fold protein [Ichthyenterobacterium sp. W332]MDT0558927.1 alpha/beta hydrolase-fold protein [Ichthyenterobacterium sp. W332]
MKNILVLLVLCVICSCKNEKGQIKGQSSNDTDATSVTIFSELNSAELSSGTLYRSDRFPSQYIMPRPVDVWLPKGYSKDKKYAVLYMHDGQMLFDSTTTWNKQEWKVDEWATQLMEENKTKDFIVVAVHNIPKVRWQDLFPQKAFKNINLKVRDSLITMAKQNNFNTNLNGDNYLKFIVEELKPIIDSTYSVYNNRNETFIMGSSMGGLMSMYAMSEYPEIFVAAACISTHWVGVMPKQNNPYPDAIFKYMSEHFPIAGQHKVYFDYGNKTLDQFYPQYAPRVDSILKEKGYTDSDSKNLFFEGTDHSENSWNKRLDQPLIFLLGNN